MPKSPDINNDGDKKYRTAEQTEIFNRNVDVFLHVIEEAHQASPNSPLENLAVDMLSAYQEATRVFLIANLKTAAPYINIAKVQELIGKIQ